MHSGRLRLLQRAEIHGYGLSARVLPALSRLREILPAVGARALPQPQKCQYALGAVRDVTRRSAAPATPENPTASKYGSHRYRGSAATTNRRARATKRSPPWQRAGFHAQIW